MTTYFMWGLGRKKHASMVFALAMHRSHEKFSAFTNIKYGQIFSDIKRENQNFRKIGSVARKMKNTSTGASTNPTNLDFNKNLNLIEIDD